MKKVLILIGLFFLTLQGGCQNAGQTFNAPIRVIEIIYADGTKQTTAFAGQALNVTWESILSKPLTFAPALHDHNALYKPIGSVPTWSEIASKPTAFTPIAHVHTSAEISGTVDIYTGIAGMDYLPIPGKTTAQISAMVLPAGKYGIVRDTELNVFRLWDGTQWINDITNK